jgi:hypothetical protein
MSNVHLRIDRISIRTQGISPTVAQAAGEGIGSALQAGLAGQLGRSPVRAPVAIPSLKLGPLRITNGQDAVQVKAAIAQAVTQAVLNTLQSNARRTL